MTSETTPKTLREIKRRFGPGLEISGFGKEVIALVQAVFENSLRGDAQRTYADLRVENYKSLSKLGFLESRSIISNVNGYYQVGFSAFALLLYANKPIASPLRKEADKWLKLAKKWLRENPNISVLPAHELAGKSSYFDLSPLAHTSLKLLSTSAGGIHLVGGDGQSVSVTDYIFEFDDTLAYVARALENLIPRHSHSSEDFEFAQSWYSSLKLSEMAFSDAQKAIARCGQHPDSAISSARAALESTFKWIADDSGVQLTASMGPGQMFAACKPSLGLDRQHSVGLARALANITHEIGEIRNVLGDSHGRPPQAVSATRAEARLVVGSALLVAAYLMDRREAAKLGAG